MNGQQPLNSLQFNHEFFFNEKIKAPFPHQFMPVRNIEYKLSCKRNLAQRKLHGQSLFVNRLQIARPQLTRNFNSRSDYAMSQLIQLCFRFNLGVLGVLAVQSKSPRCDRINSASLMSRG